MAALMLTGPPLILLYLVLVVLNRLFGWCPELQATHHRLPHEEEETAQENETKIPPPGVSYIPSTPASLEKEAKILSGVSYMPASPSLEKYPGGNTNNHYIIVLNGLTKKKLLEGDEIILDP